MKMATAKQKRQTQYEKKRKECMLYVVKQQLVADYKQKQILKTYEQIGQKRLAREWARRIRTWRLLKHIAALH